MPELEPEYVDFYEEVPAADEPEAPTGDDLEPSAEDEPEDEPEDESGGDDDESEDKPEGKKDPRSQKVPFKRYQKTRNELADERKKREELERELAEAKASKSSGAGDGADDEPELDDRSRKAVEKFMASKGYVTKQELDQEAKLSTARKQVESDKTELSKWAGDEGYPEFNAVAVDKWADKNLGQGFVKNKASLKAAYLAMHEDAIAEVHRKRAIAGTSGARPAAERPGTGAQTTPSEGDNPEKSSLGNRISRAMHEINSN